MAHPLLKQPPGGKLQYKIRLPPLQPLTETIAGGLRRSMITRDSLRLARTSQTNVLTGPVRSPQNFAIAGIGYPNAAESMRPGILQSNARRLMGKSRGQGEGI